MKGLFGEEIEKKIKYISDYLDNPKRAGPEPPPVGIDDDFIR